MTMILSASCDHCGIAVDLQVVDWDPTMPALRQSYSCPECRERHTVEVPGQIVLVVRRVIPRVPVAR
jgi:hypothetical protein